MATKRSGPSLEADALQALAEARQRLSRIPSKGICQDCGVALSHFDTVYETYCARCKRYRQDWERGQA